MKIECLIIRPGGTKVDFDAPKRQYHFKPDAEFDGRHIATVGETSHAAMLLRIREAYRAVEGDVVQAPGEDDTDLPTRVLNGSQVHDARYVIHGGDEIELDDLVSMAFDDSGLSEAEWNDLPDQERYEFIDATLSELVNGESGSQEPPAPVTINIQSSAENHVPVQLNPTDLDNTPAPQQPAPVVPEVLAPASEAPTPSEPTADELANLDEHTLREKFKEKFGRYPSKQMKPANIVAALAEDDD
ncbi:putative endoglucanase [Erwinia phage Pavtok]|uniref:Putative endoglucanase n=1 Tax=Erwinia phage Pavtok TaxID=2267655 RepID=A0A345BLW9_9CAUD|nr:putative endoglucanase [Erwinia phage Pavtok]AXF51440.1 putative endoglucanase [Erwinia phage Pavtok]